MPLLLSFTGVATVRLSISPTILATGILAASAFVATVAIGGTDSGTSAPTAFAATIPDGELDVCVWTFDGAAADLDAVGQRLAEIDDTPLGDRLGLGVLGADTSNDCPGKPSSSGVRMLDGPKGPKNVFAPQREGATGLVEARGGTDLWVFVVPQAVAESVGDTWLDRRVGWEAAAIPGGGLAEVSSAVLLGDEELRDVRTLTRFLIVGLGLATYPDARPYVDGTCRDAAPKECGTDIADAK